MKNKNFTFHILTSKFQKGFTMLEVIVAISMLTVGIIGASALITQTISLAATSSNRLIASFLAQEGIELVRNIRDRNWLQGLNWDSGLDPDPNGYQIDYDDSDLSPYSDLSFLKIDSNLYNYSSGNLTKFKRKITLSVPSTSECPAGDCFSVKVEVFWQEKRGSRTFLAQENLYNWR